MKITVLAHSEEVPHLERMIMSLAGESKAPLDCKFYESYDDFIKGFPKDTSQAVVVARRGADGMECARNARLIQPEVPLVWLSDDEGFGTESYRIGCVFFSAESITENLLSSALHRCEV